VVEEKKTAYQLGQQIAGAGKRSRGLMGRVGKSVEEGLLARRRKKRGGWFEGWRERRTKHRESFATERLKKTRRRGKVG